MDFRYGEESKSWSEEESDDRLENNNEERSSGRSYECVFCKRGFTTAQALGGHMNIHRKDRAKSTKSSYAASSSTKSLVDDHAISSFPPHNYFSPEVVDHNNNYNCLSSQFSLPSSLQYSDHQRDRDMLGGDYNNWSTGMSLYNPVYEPHNNKAKMGSRSSEDDGLDLELRLGYHS